MSKRTVAAKAEPATTTTEQVGEILGRFLKALTEPAEAPPASREPEPAVRPFRIDTLDRMAEHRDFAGRVAALTVAIQRDYHAHDAGLVPDLLHALEDLAHAEYSTVAGNMSAIVELQTGREVTA